MPMLSEKYRAEECAKTAPDAATKVAWTEIAIEWHALATKTAVGLLRTWKLAERRRLSWWRPLSIASARLGLPTVYPRLTGTPGGYTYAAKEAASGEDTGAAFAAVERRQVT
jgi:hypothetical protein